MNQDYLIDSISSLNTHQSNNMSVPTDFICLNLDSNRLLLSQQTNGFLQA